MHYQQLAELLGQDLIAAQLTDSLGDPEVHLVRLTGSAGSGKSYIARQVAEAWRRDGGTCVVAVGDDEHAWRELYPLLSGLSLSHRDWVGLASTGTRSVVQVADKATGAGGVGSSIFDLLTATFRQQTDRVLRPYSSLERDVLLDLKRLARRKRVLLIADNAHWWDDVSLRLLADVLFAPIREAISQLNSVAVLLVDTAEDQSVVAPEAFHRLAAKCWTRTWQTTQCTRDMFPHVLSAFGASDLPGDVLQELFDVTHGHLKLAEQIAAYEMRTAGGQTKSIDASFLSTLVSDRFASLGSLSPEVMDLLVRAAVLGLSCTEQDLGCLAEREHVELRALLRRAEDIGFIERGDGQITFSHDVIRSVILGDQPSSRLQHLYLKLSECLAVLRPGDYEARTQALAQAGDESAAREMLALACVAQARRGVPATRILGRVTLQRPDDEDLKSYVSVIIEGYSAVAAGNFAAMCATLRVPLPTETVAMAAERNYLAAICLLGQQTIAGAVEAGSILNSWAPTMRNEVELNLRFLVLLQQAQVLSEMFDAARKTEMRIEQKLSRRTEYDIDARVMIQVQNRRAGGLMDPEVAEDRIRDSVSFFTQGTGEPMRDQLELFRSLTNLAAIEVRLNNNAEAYQHALAAERIAVDSLDVGHRLDVLASNLVLAGYRSGALTLDEAVARQTLIAHRAGGSEDHFCERCNLVAYLLLGSRDAEAAAEMDFLEKEADENETDETYLVYYWRALSVASAAVRGEIDEAAERHAAMDSFVASLKWPCASYIRRRQQKLGELLPTLRYDDARASLDTALIDSGPKQIGRAWSYYARLIPCCELSFWADS